MSDKEIDGYYKRQARDIVDRLFDLGYFDRDVKRKDLRDVEHLMAYLYQSNADSVKNTLEFTRKIRETKDD